MCLCVGESVEQQPDMIEQTVKNGGHFVCVWVSGYVCDMKMCVMGGEEREGEGGRERRGKGREGGREGEREGGRGGGRGRKGEGGRDSRHRRNLTQSMHTYKGNHDDGGRQALRWVRREVWNEVCKYTPAEYQSQGGCGEVKSYPAILTLQLLFLPVPLSPFHFLFSPLHSLSLSFLPVFPFLSSLLVYFTRVCSTNKLNYENS